ncbi:ATP-binding cassette domain-containing protein [Roseibium salinum]|nr:ATP-binding cassette domain-containing protein [Roseibium salinum]
MIGPNGAGKTTLFNAISGYARPTAGSVLLEDAEIVHCSPHAIAEKKGCGGRSRMEACFLR